MIWRWNSRIGPFFIVERGAGRFMIWFDDDWLDGPFRSAAQAAEQLAGGYTPTPARGADPASLSIPQDIGEWDIVQRFP